MSWVFHRREMMDILIKDSEADCKVEWERERERDWEFVFVCVWERARERECVCVCVFVWHREKETKKRDNVCVCVCASHYFVRVFNCWYCFGLITDSTCFSLCLLCKNFRREKVNKSTSPFPKLVKMGKNTSRAKM